MNTSIGFNQLLTLIFITLKLTDIIDWSWWYVLAPTLIPFVIVIGIVFIAIVSGYKVKVK